MVYHQLLFASIPARTNGGSVGRVSHEVAKVLANTLETYVCLFAAHLPLRNGYLLSTVILQSAGAFWF